MQVSSKQQAVACSAIEGFAGISMIRAYSALFAIAALLVVAMAASAQVRLHSSEDSIDLIDNARETLGLSDEQVDQIREIRSTQPPEDLSRDELRAWHEKRQAQVADLLTADQKSKLAEIEASRQQLRALLGSSMLSLDQAKREDRNEQFERTRPQRDDWFYGADRSWYPRRGRQPGWGRSGRGGPFGTGRGGRGRRGGNRF